MRRDEVQDETRRFYDRISPVYDFIADSSEHEARELGLRLLAVSPGDRVLEIGCGTGHALVSLMNSVGNAGRVCGIDISAGMVASAHSLVLASGGYRVGLAINDVRSLCFASNAFDSVFMSFTLELLDVAIPRVLAEVRRVLKPAGRIAVVALAKAELPTVASHVYEWAHRHWPHVVDCTPIDVVGLLRTAGFEVADVASTHIWTLPVAIVVGKQRA
jgi:demethylmenaquinone methyltransferase/2-methoxy-6-polyprenyl-1,4-benzoquinol methylase